MDVNSELERFGKDVAANEALRKELSRIGSDDVAVVAFARSKGYSFTLDDVKAFQSTFELAEDKLERVAGGAVPWSSRATASTCPKRPLDADGAAAAAASLYASDSRGDVEGRRSWGLRHAEGRSQAGRFDGLCRRRDSRGGHSALEVFEGRSRNE